MVIGGQDALNADMDHFEGLLHDHKGMEPVAAPTTKKWGTVRKAVRVNSILGGWKSATDAGNRGKLVFQVFVVLVAGCLSVIPSELIVKKDPQGMQIITVANFMFAICSSLAGGGLAIITSRKVPMTFLGMMVIANYGYSALQNMAFGMGLSMPIALVAKNGGLLAQMLVGKTLIGETYTMRQVFSALAVTFGILIVVFSNMKPKAPKGDSQAKEDDGMTEVVAVFLLLCAMLARALGNSTTQTAFKACGKQVNESLFYVHLLGLPLLLFNWRAMLVQAIGWSAGSMTEELFGYQVPILWVYLMGAMSLNFVVTKACAEVVGLSSSVMLNLILTLQRFISIVISACIFNAPPYPPLMMWLGAALVIAGCINYVIVPKEKQ